MRYYLTFSLYKKVFSLRMLIVGRVVMWFANIVDCEVVVKGRTRSRKRSSGILYLQLECAITSLYVLQQKGGSSNRRAPAAKSASAPLNQQQLFQCTLPLYFSVVLR